MRPFGPEWLDRWPGIGPKVPEWLNRVGWVGWGQNLEGSFATVAVAMRSATGVVAAAAV
jgi:hypothetical protein